MLITCVKAPDHVGDRAIEHNLFIVDNLITPTLVLIISSMLRPQCAIPLYITKHYTKGHMTCKLEAGVEKGRKENFSD